MKGILYICLGGVLAACSGGNKSVTGRHVDGSSVYEVAAEQVKGLPSAFDVRKRDGKVLTHQLTSDSTLLVLWDGDETEALFEIVETATPVSTDTLVSGRVYPERADDLAWENSLVGFRAYGPATQAKGERAYGYDLFFKYHDKGLVLERLYAPETSPRTWEKVDSLRKIDPELADDYIASFSYHIDHGLGMDCYPCGPTLGAGVAALCNSTGEIVFPWCYETVEVLDNGPLRFKAHLVFPPVVIDSDTAVVEHRIITLDEGSNLNRTEVWYDGLTKPHAIVVGMPRRDASEALMDVEAGMIRYTDPTDHQEGNGAIIEIHVDPTRVDRMTERDGHIIAEGIITPGERFVYRWGFTWEKLVK